MSNLIELEKLIEKAKEKGIDFGKGDPYNRLRYYTKIGWLPHMTRKKDGEGSITGHYPDWVLDRLIEIENLKALGASNDEIEKKLNITNKLQNVFEFLRSRDSQNRLILLATLAIFVLILMSEFGIVKIGNTKKDFIGTANTEIPNQIVDSGTAFIPKDQKRVFVKSSKVHNQDKIYITFTQDYSPAMRYWIQEIENENGFMLELDTRVFTNSEFNWWITN